MRSILTFVLTVFITALLWVTFGNQTQTHAADPTGNWVGNSILYDGHSYNANNSATKGNTLGLPEGTPYYSYAPAASSSTGTQAKTVKAFVIYFTPGTDPPTATTATYVTYDYLPSKGYSNPNGKTALTMTPSVDKNPVSSCTVDGIGWIICPLTIFLAKGMDFIFGQIANFMAVQPVTVNNTSSSLYISWNIMRSIANIAFIIVFLIIIYSQLTNVAVSNYGIKKLLPRLIIAALLVNLSYTICSIAIDISNILGYSLQQIFVNIRANTYSITNDTWSAGTTAWTTVTAAILSGVGIGVLIADPGVIFALIPIIVGLVLTALIVLLILAARQAIIVILIIIAPLAFVAYLLPNTEQWFKKWRELFMTMLIFFPALSLVFGGSQLASSIILQNASSMMMIILGLAVQVAPLVITPIILKFSGGVLGKIGGIVNNPKKGIMDSTNAWTNKRRDRSRAAVLANQNTKNPFRRVAQRFAYNSRRVEKGTEKYKAQFEDWSSQRDFTSRTGQAIAVDTALAKARAEESNKDFEQAVQELRAGNEGGLTRLRMQERTTFTESIQSRMNGNSIEEIRNTRYTIERDLEGKVLEAKDQKTKFGKMAVGYAETLQELDATGRAIQAATGIAQNAQVTNYAEMIENKGNNARFTTLKVRAGGIAGESGQAGALAAAFKAQAEAHGTAVSNANSILSHYNYDDNLIAEIALSKKGQVPTGVTFTDKISDALKEAAIVKIAGSSNASAFMKVFSEIEIQPGEGTAQDFRQAFADTALSNSARPKFAGATILSDMKQGKAPAPGVARINEFIVGTVKGDKFGSAETLTTQDPDYLSALVVALRDEKSQKAMGDDKKATILTAIDTIRNNPIYSGKVGERKKPLDDIEALLREQTGIPRPPTPNAANPTAAPQNGGSGPGGFIMPDDPK